MVDSRIEFSEIGSIRLAKVKVSVGLSFALQPSDRSQPSIDVVLQHRGNSTLTQRGRVIPLSEGQWAILQAERFSVAAEVTGATEQIVLLIPRTRLAADLDIDRILLRALPGDSSVSQLLGNAVRCFALGIPTTLVQRAESVAQTLYGLIELALYERLSIDAPSFTKRSKDRMDAQRYIHEHLNEPQLSLKQIAAHFGYTTRYLHKIFHRSGSTVRAYILQQRLNQARDDLANPDLSNLSVTDIAISRGFSGASYFARAFRTRFGMSPKEARDRAQRRGAANNSHLKNGN